MTTTQQHDWLTPAEAADVARRHPSTIYRMVARGELPAVRFGPRRLLIARAALADAMRPASVRRPGDAA